MKYKDGAEEAAEQDRVDAAAHEDLEGAGGGEVEPGDDGLGALGTVADKLSDEVVEDGRDEVTGKAGAHIADILYRESGHEGGEVVSATNYSPHILCVRGSVSNL